MSLSKRLCNKTHSDLTEPSQFSVGVKMKKFSVLIALVLLAVAGTGYAVTCAYDNVPAATLLVPYWKVTPNGATGDRIPSGGTDTLVFIVNVSMPGVIAHVTVWNKFSKAVIDFNIPLTRSEEHTSELQSRQYLVCR